MYLLILLLITIVQSKSTCSGDGCNLNTTYCLSDIPLQRSQQSCVCQPSSRLYNTVDGQFMCLSSLYNTNWRGRFICNGTFQNCCSTGYQFDMVLGSCQPSIAPDYVPPNTNNIYPFVGEYSCVCNSTAGDDCTAPWWTQPFCGEVNGVPTNFPSKACYYRTAMYYLDNIFMYGNNTDIYFGIDIYEVGTYQMLTGYYGTCCANMNYIRSDFVLYYNDFNYSDPCAQCFPYICVGCIAELTQSWLIFGEIGWYIYICFETDGQNCSAFDPNMVNLARYNLKSANVESYKSKFELNMKNHSLFLGSNKIIKPKAKSNQRYNTATFEYDECYPNQWSYDDDYFTYISGCNYPLGDDYYIAYENYTCTTPCTIGSVVTESQYKANGLTCECSSKSISCNSGSLETITACYSDGSNFYNVIEPNCDCNLTKVSDFPCPADCAGLDAYPNVPGRCNLMNVTPIPNCPTLNLTGQTSFSCKHKSCEKCNLCPHNLPFNVGCIDTLLNGKCSALFYNICGNCIYPGLAQNCTCTSDVPPLCNFCDPPNSVCGVGPTSVCCAPSSTCFTNPIPQCIAS